MANFSIQMSEYYSKVNSLKSKVDTTTDSINTNFLNKVRDHINELDSTDQSALQYADSYTSAKKLLTTLYETHLLNLEYMSSETLRNPMYALVQKDKEYKDLFKQIAENKNTDAVTSQIGVLNTKIKDQETTTYLDDLLKIAKGIMGRDEYAQLLQLAKVNPQKAVDALLKNKTFIEALSKNENVANLFLKLMGMFDRVDGKWIDTLLNNEKFITLLQKNEKVGSAILTVMAKLESSEKILKALSVFEKVGGYGKAIVNGKVFQAGTRFLNTGFGKVISNPFVMLGVSAGLNTISEYNDKSSGAYHSPGKAVIGGSITAISSVGPVSGALMGAAVGGPIGALIGGVIGTTIWSAKMAFPNGVSDIKNGAYKAWDSTKEWVGKTAKSTVKSIVKTAGNEYNKVKNTVNEAKKVVRNLSSTMEKLVNVSLPIEGVASWFG
ncbi:hypothetical protein [Carnobacterium maltaromaticum]|uniref:hypothetical protein n=1 Tax=Carnobacterium maltaromaticum TaxID=2751 RepID=UPI00295E3AE6|nr:hypothetical protein [Carnobacterium maltaromaticum]